MAIKKMRISFDIDIATMAMLLANANTGMKIDVFGDDRPPKLAKPAVPALPPPARRARNSGLTHRMAIFKFMAEANRDVERSELIAIVTANGGAEKSTSPQVQKLYEARLVTRTGSGVYRITALGLKQYAKLKEIDHD